MKFVSWNVNGLRACVSKGFLDSFYQLDADFFCLQETKLQEGQIDLELPGYYQYWCYAEKKGYSGTAIFTKHKPLNVIYGLGVEALDTEGRLITLEYQEFYLVTCYTPNAQRELARIEHRMAWEDALREYLIRLDTQKPVVYCGDLNVAHQEIDLKNPSSNRGSAGFSDQERNAFSRLLESGFTDTFRHLYPDVTGAYSWWSYMFNARKNNAGWRIDYFVVSDRLQSAIADATIHPDILGSDHCPVGLDLDTTCNGSIWSPSTPRSIQNTNSTDRKASVGAVKAMLHIGISAITLLGILICGFAFRHSPSTAPALNAPVSTVPVELVSDIWIPTEKLELIKGANPRFRSATDVWYPVEPLVDLDAYDRAPTYYAVITFGEGIGFTKDHLPQLQYRVHTPDMYFYEPYLTHQFFYGSNGQVAGFLLMGDVPEDQDVTLIVQNVAQIYRTDLHITAEKDDTDYTQATTRQLVEKLAHSNNLTRLQPYGVYDSGWDIRLSYNIEYFMAHDPVATELLTREDAVDTMFLLMNSLIISIDPSDNLLMLLEYDAFYRQMTQEQLDEYEQRQAQRALYLEPHLKGEILYGYLDGDTIVTEDMIIYR